MTTMTNNSMMNLVLAVVASATMLSFTAVPAKASSVAVTVTKADFATAEGRAAVDARVLRAAKQACFSGDYRNLAVRAAENQCIAEAVSDARAKVAEVAFSSQLASR